MHLLQKLILIIQLLNLYLKYYNKEVNLNKIESYEEIAAHGIKVKYENEEILAGNEKLMTVNNIEVNKNEEIGTVVYIAVNNKFKGYYSYI